MTSDPFFPPDGIITFCHSPLITAGDPIQADVVVLGVPWDGGTGLRPGARHAPRALRETSQRVSLWAGEEPCGFWDVASRSYSLAGVRVVDAGDVAIVRASPDLTAQAINTEARSARKSGKILLTLGGDHSITLPLIQAFDDCKGLGVIQLDAHLDYADSIQGVRYNSSTSMRRVSELDFVGPMAVLGLHGLRTDPRAFEAALVRGNTLITRVDIARDGAGKVVEQLPPMEQVYLTIDIDVLDPQLAPGVSAPEMDGLSYAELRALLQGIARRYDIVGIDLVETSPPFDPAGLTALAGVQSLLEILACELDSTNK